MKYVILAGGGGTRLWPLSRSSRPKQFLRLIDDQTLLELTLERLGKDIPKEDVYFSVTEETAPFVREILPSVSEDQLIIEPEKRDTGPAMGFVAAVLELRDPDEPMVFLPSDHFIRDTEGFLRSLQVAGALIRETGCLLDIGVVPSSPNTNLGYTHIGERKYERNGIAVHAFLGHTEKPPLEEAKEFLESGQYLWHANYYMWTPRKFLEAYETYAPKTAATLRTIQGLWKKGDRSGVAREYATLEKISIDYAITEKIDPSRVLILKAPFDWSDVGLWSVLKKLREENPQDNVVSGSEHIAVDTENCLVYGDPKKTIATVGVRDLLIVDTGDALLICKNDRDQDIKRVVEELKRQHRNELT
jgi:mannose-1-phosphate guanylyltransferase